MKSVLLVVPGKRRREALLQAVAHQVFRLLALPSLVLQESREFLVQVVELGPGLPLARAVPAAENAVAPPSLTGLN